MRVVVVGAGPVGAVTGIGLARQGHEVTVVDRDPGPPAQGTWTRTGVTQFRHPHGYRPNVHAVLSDLMPDVWERLVDAGCQPVVVPGAPPGTLGLHARRATFERGLRRALAEQPGLVTVVGSADEVVVRSGRPAGVRVTGSVLPADCVVVAGGRSGRLGAGLRARPEGGPCGLSYTSRVYRARPGAGVELPPLPLAATGDGFLAIVFPHEQGMLSALVVRPANDPLLARMRHNEVFDRVAARIDHLAPWTDPARFEPVTDALPGGALTNLYQSVLDVTGRCAVPGLLFAGDAVLTTNPQAGRGIATGLEQARVLLRLLADARDLAEVAVAFDAWCAANLRPWFEDHVHLDAALLRRWAGHDLADEARIPSDVVCAASAVDPRIAPAAAAYGAMAAPPKALDPFREDVRALLRSGWRPPLTGGPTRRELAGLAAARPALAGAPGTAAFSR